jgi:hypothetical protein
MQAPQSIPGRLFRLGLAATTLFLMTAAAASIGSNPHQTNEFKGAKVHGGFVTHSTRDGHSVLTLSPDFKVPDTPAPHWQVVDSQGNTYLLQRLKVKALAGEKVNQSITLPPYIKDVAKVQIWCAWAEALLGEASFPAPVR